MNTDGTQPMQQSEHRHPFQSVWINRLHPSDVQRPLINGFIVLHILIMVVWSFPPHNKVHQWLADVVRPYVVGAGLWQNWDMFSPDPRGFNCYEEAEIDYKDGSQSTWAFPRMEKLGPWDRYRKERYRKWANDNLRDDAQAFMWPATARYIARLESYRTMKTPITVRLIRRWAMIPLPQTHNTPAVPQWNRYVFFSTPIRLEDIQ